MECEVYLDYLTKKEGWKMKVNEDMKKAKVVCFYFSAAWCPPCRGFTPILTKFYEQVNEEGKNLEIIYISIDQDESEFKAFFLSMPWLAVPFKFDRKELAKQVGI